MKIRCLAVLHFRQVRTHNFSFVCVCVCVCVCVGGGDLEVIYNVCMILKRMF